MTHEMISAASTSVSSDRTDMFASLARLAIILLISIMMWSHDSSEPATISQVAVIGLFVISANQLNSWAFQSRHEVASRHNFEDHVITCLHNIASINALMAGIDTECEDIQEPPRDPN